jgi:hypothetical protein
LENEIFEKFFKNEIFGKKIVCGKATFLCRKVISNCGNAKHQAKVQLHP